MNKMNISLQKRSPFCICGYCKETDLAACGEDLGKLWKEYELKKGSLDTFCNNPDSFYGLMWSTEGGRYCYLIGVETDSPGPYPAGTVCKSVAAAEYAVASIPVSKSAIGAWTEFYNRALPDAGLEPAPGHVYDFEFYPKGGNADYELWTPVIKKQKT